MNPETRRARRYHWQSEGLGSFVEAPHAAILGRGGGEIVNLTDRRAAGSRAAQLALLGDLGPDRLVAAVAALARRPAPAAAPLLPHLALPAHHEVRPSDVILRRLHGTLAAAADRGPADFAELLLVPGVGARTVEALAAVAEVVHGTPCRFADPARFALAHGGKDGHPFPVPLAVYDRTIAVMRAAVDRARLGDDERLAAVRRLDAEARRLERAATGPALPAFLAAERRRSPGLGGMTVTGPATRPRRAQ